MVQGAGDNSDAKPGGWQLHFMDQATSLAVCRDLYTTLELFRVTHFLRKPLAMEEY